MSNEPFREWRDKGKHLPEWMRDFHDAKDLFKCIHEMYGHDEKRLKEMPDWVQAQCYTVDWFLWFMAMHGYTLQKSHAKGMQFHDIRKTVNDSAKDREDQFIQLLNNHMAKQQKNHEGEGI